MKAHEESFITDNDIQNNNFSRPISIISDDNQELNDAVFINNRRVTGISMQKICTLGPNSII